MPSIPSRSAATARTVSSPDGAEIPDHAGAIHRPEQYPPSPGARTASPAIAALRRRPAAPAHEATPETVRPRPDHRIIDTPPEALRPDHHVIDIDPPPQQAAPPRVAPNIAAPVVPVLHRRTTLKILHRIQNTMGATSLAFSMSGLRFPGYGLEKVGLGLVLVSAPLTLAIVYGTLQARRIEAEALRRPELRGLPLDQVIKQFCGPDTAAAHFDWNAPGLFVNTMGADMTDEVSHILARAFAAAGTPAGSSLAPELRAYADNLASSADLRTALAQTAYEANAACDDRVGIRLGELMLAGIMHTVRDKAAKPRAVVGTLVLHAATRAMEQRISALLAQGQAPEATAPPPSAELMLAGCHAVQAALIRRGMAVPNLFREQLFSMDDLRRHRNNVVAVAEEIADACCPPTASGEQAGHAVAVFLKHHGGEAAMQILSTRLAHLTEPLEADVQKTLGALDEALEESTDPTNPVMTDEQYRHEADQLKRDYDAGVARVRAQAIAGALAGEDADWMAPEAPASTSEPAPLQDPGETSADAEANASQAPHGYDPTKGKWKTD